MALWHRPAIGRGFLASGRRSLAAVIAVALLLRLSGLGWGLPASDGWDDDGVAPRDFLVGVLETYWPGHHFTYPPLHLIALTLLSAPVWATAVWRAPSLAPAALVQAFIHVPTMTALALVARATTVALSLGLLWGLASIGEDLRGSSRAGAWVAAACGANAVLTYYSQTSNLDVPYLFWGVFALRALVHAIAHRAPRSLRQVPVLAALAIATKDQAYALFLGGIPLAIAVWWTVDPWPRPRLGTIVGELARGASVAIVAWLVVDGALTNPWGFADRMRFLVGTASQDHAFYAADASGRLSVLRDVAWTFRQHYPWPFAGLAACGLAVVVARTPSPSRRAAGLVPLWVALSFTLAFNLAARRTEHRFVLPQTLMWGLYAGIALDAAQTWFAAARVRGFGVLAGGLFGPALFQCAAVDRAMLSDPRYDAEAWLRRNLRSGDRVEVYDNNVHLPRLPAMAAVDRIDLTPASDRSPLPGVREVRDRLSHVDARRPRFIVVSDFFSSKYLLDPAAIDRLGRVLSAMQVRAMEDLDTRAYVRALFDEKLPYRPAHVSAYDSRVWPELAIHASLCGRLWIFERIEEAGAKVRTP